MNILLWLGGFLMGLGAGAQLMVYVIGKDIIGAKTIDYKGKIYQCSEVK